MRLHARGIGARGHRTVGSLLESQRRSSRSKAQFAGNLLSLASTCADLPSCSCPSGSRPRYSHPPGHVPGGFMGPHQRWHGIQPSIDSHYSHFFLQPPAWRPALRPNADFPSGC